MKVKNCTNIGGAKVFVILYANCCANCYYNFNPRGIFLENDVIVSNLEQGKLMETVNSRK